MSLNKKIGYLLDNGFKPNFVSSLNEGKINLIYERLKKKKETKEITMVSGKSPNKDADIAAAKQRNDTIQIYEDDTEIEQDPYSDYKNTQNLQQRGPSDYGDNPKLDKEMDDYDADGMGIMEKFESKAQQGLFWARCNKCKDKNCEWCKRAKEFSKETSKKQYKTMPEKKHPEKTVKYKKKKTNEEFTMANYLDKVASVYANNAMSKTIDSQLHKEQSIKKHLGNLIENNLKPTMKKRDLLRLIESEIQKKKGLNEDFYSLDERFEEDDFMMDAPTIAPTKPKIKPKRETEPSEPEWEPGEEDVPNPNTEPEPQAKDDEHHSMMSKFKNKFKMDMDRLDSTTHKPHRFKKY